MDRYGGIFLQQQGLSVAPEWSREARQAPVCGWSILNSLLLMPDYYQYL